MNSDNAVEIHSVGKVRRTSLIPDQPISTIDQDKLERRAFASQLAAQLNDYRDERCLVVALYAPWGAGKSSLLNLLEDQLTNQIDDPERRPIVIRFNPWNFADLNSLLSMFFRELQINLGKSNSTLERNIQTSLHALSLLLAAGELSPAGGSWFRLLSDFFKWGAQVAKERTESLVTIKGHINANLRELDRRLFVLIDDIDRLDQESMRFMFRLIRLNADFDRMTYVLAFDKAVVASVLTQEQGMAGYDYLEKIVQVGFDIPPAEPSKLDRSLSDALENLGFPTLIDEDSHVRWLDLKTGVLDKLIRTPRDIVRYVNGLTINGGIVIDEVNPVDFAGIEALRTFAPKVHAFIRDNRDLVIGRAAALIVDNEAMQTERREKLEQVYSSCKAELKPHIREACQQIFPAIDSLYADSTPRGESPEELREARRICTVGYFARYFYLRPFDQEVTQAQFAAILTDASDCAQFVGKLNELIASGKTDSFLGRLRDAVPTLSEENIEPVVQALLEAGDKLEGPATFENRLPEVAFIVHKLLLRLTEPSRIRILHKAVTNAPSLGFLIGMHRLYGEHDRMLPRIVNEVERSELHNELIARIRSAARDMELAQSPHLGLVLYCWAEWTTVEEIQEFVRRLTESEDGVLKFLQAMIAERATFPGRHVSQRGWYLPIKNVRTFIDPELLIEPIERIRRERWANMTDLERAAVDAFDAGLKGSEPEMV